MTFSFLRLTKVCAASACFWAVVAYAAPNVPAPSAPAPKPTVSGSPAQNDPATSNLADKTQDKKTELETLVAVASAAIDAARHATEESKDYYKEVIQALSLAAGAIAAIAGVGGFLFLNKRAETIAKEQAESILASKKADLEAEWAQKKKEIEDLRSDFDKHILKYGELAEKVENLQIRANKNLKSFVVVVPKAIQMTIWVSQHGHKPATSRPDPEPIASALIDRCLKALSDAPTDATVLSYIYGSQGIAYHLLGKYSSAYDAFSNCLTHEQDNPNTLFNMACCTCAIGKLDEAKKCLRRVVALQPHRTKDIWNDSDFEPLRNDPEFIQIVGTSLAPDQAHAT